MCRNPSRQRIGPTRFGSRSNIARLSLPQQSVEALGALCHGQSASADLLQDRSQDSLQVAASITRPALTGRCPSVFFLQARRTRTHGPGELTWDPGTGDLLKLDDVGLSQFTLLFGVLQEGLFAD